MPAEVTASLIATAVTRGVPLVDGAAPMFPVLVGAGTAALPAGLESGSIATGRGRAEGLTLFMGVRQAGVVACDQRYQQRHPPAA